LLGLMRLVETRRYGDIEQAARRVLARNPGQALAAKVLSFAMVGMGRYQEAMPLLEDLVRKQAHDPEIHNNLGIALCAMLRWEESIACFQKALSLDPDDPEILKNLGAAYADQKQWNAAVPWLLHAIEKHPGDYVEAVSLLGACLMNANRVEEALACYRELWQADPSDVASLYQLIFGSLRICDWQHLDERIAWLRERSDGFSRPLDSPFAALSLVGFDGSDHRRIAEAHARNVISSHTYKAGADWRPSPAAVGARRLRVGYLSADFRYHAVGFVIPELIERHDRARVEVIGYSTGVDDGSEIRARLMRAFDRFVDLKAESIPKVVDRIRQDEIDILVDLQGWTTDCRPEILALRCARVHVNWLGYAGTMGHPQLADYIVGDPVVTPRDDAALFTEAIAQLPHCYLPADSTRQLLPAPTRAAEGLPDEAFVFCSLNNNYKFNPANFDLWCRLLREVPNSVLWLSRPNDSAVANLRQEVQRRGIVPERLLFARRVENPADHLARLQLADLALDSFPYNSHSSGIDTLWAGVPMVTVLGDTFASRVGASLLKVVGLDELVATDTEAYFDMALALARDPKRLRLLREHLTSGRSSFPLFDMKGMAYDLEQVFFRMHENAAAGRREPILA
jgi:predicted O-linked N-acetylglucosamine transferase (SPINDLY family)